MNIYEKHPTIDAYRFGPSFTPHAIVAKDKRFTDAELAAEYWAARNEKQGPHGLNRKLKWFQMCALERFAALPHFDEDTQ